MLYQEGADEYVAQVAGSVLSMLTLYHTCAKKQEIVSQTTLFQGPCRRDAQKRLIRTDKAESRQSDEGGNGR
jgi:hypothetical protein